MIQGGKTRPSGPVVIVGGCSGSKPIEYASEDITFLRQYRQSPQPAKIIGSVRAGDGFFGWRDDHPPIAGVDVEIRGSDKSVNIKTDAQGNFAVLNLKPGAYTLRAAMPSYRVGMPVYQIEVPEHGCGVAKIELMTNARVSGQVLRHDGSPAANVPVELMFADPRYRNSYFRLNAAKTDSQGRFRIAGLPAGDFLIGAYIVSGPTMNARIPPTYWPRTTARAKAEVLHLLPDQDRGGVAIHLAAPVKTRKVNVHVRWPDGRPAKADYVFVSPDVPNKIEGTSDGTITLLEGVEYKFSSRLWTSYRKVNGNKTGDKFVDAEGVLPAGNGPAEITLVMDKPCCGKT